MKDPRPFIFEVDRGDGEKIKVLYSKANDTFFQMQEALSENSCFLGKAIMREARVYSIAEIDPIFFLLRALRTGQKFYQTLS